MTGYLVIDSSSWGGQFTDAEAEAAKAQGARLLVVNTWGEWTRQQAEMGLKHGMTVEAYEYMYLSIDPAIRIKHGLDALYGFPLKGIWWLDYEDPEAPTYSPREVVAHVRRAIAFCNEHGLSPGIYTRRSWWDPYTDSCTEFGHLPLWEARYDGVPNFDYFKPWCGWQRPLMKQFAGTTDVGGQSVDLSWREDDMTDADKARLYVLTVLQGVNEALAQGRIQDAVNGLKKYLGVVAK